MKRTPWIVAVLLLAPACGPTRPGVSNGSVSACFRAEPIARTALHDPKARLIGVHRVPLDKVRARLPAQVGAELQQESDTEVCTMAFRGPFKAGQVDMAPPAESGDYALVLVSSRKLQLLDAVVLDHLPKAFGGRVV